MPLEDEFTEVMRSIADMPKLLYFRGILPEKRTKTVAIVGARKMTTYGQEVAYDLAFALARRGVVVVSGLAYGIDGVAHRACLDAGGITVAVLGTRIDHLYPRGHVRLAEEIIRTGVILSEYGPEDAVLPRASFVLRNRIVSGLADEVIVVEAAEGSGTLTTAELAVKQGRKLWAVPGNVGQPMSEGCNRLIAEGKARMATSVTEVVEEICGEKQEELVLSDRKDLRCERGSQLDGRASLVQRTLEEIGL